MADIADDGADRAEFFLKLAKQRQEDESKRLVLPAIGRCYNCDELLGDDRRWCDEDCKADWEHREKRKGE